MFYMLQIEAPIKMALQLLERNLAVVTGIYFVADQDIVWTIHHYAEHLNTNEKVVTGIMMRDS